MNALGESNRVTVPRLIIIGLITGLLSGAFGVGGGILIVPALVLIAGMQQKIAHGTSLAAVVPISIVGATTYAVAGNLDLPATGLLMLGTVVGAFWGTRLLDWFPTALLRWLFIAFMIIVATRLLFEVPDRGGQLEISFGVAIILVLVGLGTGALSGLLGVGGGVFLVPIMIIFLGMSDVIAKGVSLLVVIPTGIVATYFSLRRGNVNLKVAGIVGVSGMATSVVGAMLAFILDASLSSILFAALLLGVSVRMIIHASARQRK